MARNSKNSRLVLLVLTIVIGVIAAGITYITWKGGVFEVRSKAADNTIILKNWPFINSDAGWQATGFASATVRDSKYVLVTAAGDTVPNIRNSWFQTVLKYPLNKFRIWVMIDNPPYPAPGDKQTVPVEVAYRLENKNQFESPVTLQALNNGKIDTLSFDFPKELSLKKIGELTISFPSLRGVANARVVIQEIRIVGVKSN